MPRPAGALARLPVLWASLAVASKCTAAFRAPSSPPTCSRTEDLCQDDEFEENMMMRMMMMRVRRMMRMR
eukprot:780869-Rhodomonas_salina.1